MTAKRVSQRFSGNYGEKPKGSILMGLWNFLTMTKDTSILWNQWVRFGYVPVAGLQVKEESRLRSGFPNFGEVNCNGDLNAFVVW